MILLEAAQVLTETEDGSFLILEPGFLGIEGDKIAYIGKTRPNGFENARLIKVNNGIILPGFVDVHYHADTPVTKGFIEDVGSINFYGSILYEHLPAIYAATSREEWVAIARLTLLEMIKNGITTAVEFNSYFPEDLFELLKESGMRGYIAPETNSLTDYPHSVDGKTIEINEVEEVHLFDKLNRNLVLIEKLNGSNNDLVRITLGPTEPPACTPKLLREIRKYAEVYRVPITMHAAETIIERNYIKERYNRTSIEYLEENGISGSDVILAHVMYTRISDLRRLYETKTNVAHCPTIFARRGVYLNSLDKYLTLGINVGIGTDTFPQDMFEEIKVATICSKIADGDFASAPSQMVYKCATINGAKALGRNDIGVLKVGNKADVIIVDLDNYNLVPTRDPIRVLVSCGAGNNVDTTIVNGEILMENRKLLKISESVVIEEAKTASKNVWKKAKDIDKLSPLSVPIFK